jgi:hypothetical protein
MISHAISNTLILDIRYKFIIETVILSRENLLEVTHRGLKVFAISTVEIIVIFVVVVSWLAN